MLPAGSAAWLTVMVQVPAAWAVSWLVVLMPFMVLVLPTVQMLLVVLANTIGLMMGLMLLLAVRLRVSPRR